MSKGVLVTLILLFVWLIFNFIGEKHTLISYTLKNIIQNKESYFIGNLNKNSRIDFFTKEESGNPVRYIESSDTIRVIGIFKDTCISVNEKIICFLELPEEEVKSFFDETIKKSFILYEIKWRPFWYTIELVYYDKSIVSRGLLDDFPMFDIYVLSFFEEYKILGYTALSGWPHKEIGKFNL